MNAEQVFEVHDHLSASDDMRRHVEGLPFFCQLVEVSHPAGGIIARSLLRRHRFRARRD